MSARTLQTFEQFEQYHDDGKKHELLKGEHIVVPPPKFRHTRIQQKIQDALRPYVRDRGLGEVHIEAGFKLSANSWLQPDLSVVRTAQLDASRNADYLEGGPAIAIEVASESNTAAQLDMKMELYFAHGSEEVWVVYPTTRRICVHRPDGASRTLEANTELRSDVLPGWSVAVDSLFED